MFYFILYILGNRFISTYIKVLNNYNNYFAIVEMEFSLQPTYVTKTFCVLISKQYIFKHTFLASCLCNRTKKGVQINIVYNMCYTIVRYIQRTWKKFDPNGCRSNWVRSRIQYT